MPLQATSGAASYDGFGGGVAVVPQYIEDVFSTYLYTGNGGTQTINNGIDLSTKGGLVWTKGRGGITDHILIDSARGLSSRLYSNEAFAAGTGANDITAFNVNGFSLGLNTYQQNNSGTIYASWTFRKQPKFFDVVTWTGSNDVGTSIGQGIVPHNLGAAPGCVIIKNVTQGSTNWIVYHRSLSGGYRMLFNTTDAQTNSSPTSYFAKYVGGVGWTQTNPDATNIYVGNNYQTNGNTDTLVAYLFAHDAGGFGLTGTDNVISCGSYTGNGTSTGPVVSLGYEPQWLLVKSSTYAVDWLVYDNMRGAGSNNTVKLQPNTSNAEDTAGEPIGFNATGFQPLGADSEINRNANTYIYIAIRRGPMKVPTLGTSVFNPTAWTGSSTTRINTTGFVTDLNISRMRQNISSGSNLGAYWVNRLTGASPYLRSDATSAEATQTDGLTSFASNTAVTFGADSSVQAWNFDNNYRNYSFRRAPSFMDVVCWTGNGVAGRTVSHNLAAVPELIIGKTRSNAIKWTVYSASVGNTAALFLNLTDTPETGSYFWNNTSPTSTNFTLGDSAINNNGDTQVAYLFATCAGVSKVGSYTGNGTTQTINCGFVAGARFVMVKATSTTGNWIFVDTNGINTGNDRALYMNNADVESFAYDWIDIDSTGFIVNETAVIAANTNGVSYIFLAIA
jgi:hypothetical protein